MLLALQGGLVVVTVAVGLAFIFTDSSLVDWFVSFWTEAAVSSDGVDTCSWPTDLVHCLALINIFANPVSVIESVSLPALADEGSKDVDAFAALANSRQFHALIDVFQQDCDRVRLESFSTGAESHELSCILFWADFTRISPALSVRAAATRARDADTNRG